MLVFLLDSIIVHDLLLILVVISLIIISVTMVYLVYFQKNQVKKDNDQNSDNLDLRELSKKLENLPKNTTMNLTDFEKDQEEKAIISYDELLNNKNNVSIGYEKSELKDNIEVKKISIRDGDIVLYSGDVKVFLGKKTMYDDEISALSSILETVKKEGLKGTIDMKSYKKGDDRAVVILFEREACPLIKLMLLYIGAFRKTEPHDFFSDIRKDIRRETI